MAHKTRHHLAGKTVSLIDVSNGSVIDVRYKIEDWWDVLGSGSWAGLCETVPACAIYNDRIIGLESIPFDEEVVYGKVDGLGYLIHESELGQLV